MIKKYLKLIILFFVFLSFEANAQKGIVANYKAELMTFALIHIKTEEILNKPITMGTDLEIQYNLSFERLTISYNDAQDGKPKFFYLTFIKNDDNGGVIMEDSHGNPFTVYNKLSKDGSLSIIHHGLVEGGYVAMQIILDAKKVYKQ